MNYVEIIGEGAENVRQKMLEMMLDKPYLSELSIGNIKEIAEAAKSISYGEIAKAIDLYRTQGRDYRRPMPTAKGVVGLQDGDQF